MTARVHELITAQGRKSRLTITPSRVTVKVSRDDEALAGDLAAAGRRIAGRVPLDAPSLRGCFSVASRRVILRSNSGDRKLAFTFDGEQRGPSTRTSPGKAC